MEHAFGRGRPFSVGVEEELFLVDPVTGGQANSSAAVIERLDRDDVAPGQIEQELHACEVEVISDPCEDVGEAVQMLGALRREVLRTGTGLLGAGTHPSAREGAAEITDKDRYERIRNLLGDAAATPVAGLHVHVGMPDAPTAIRVFNGLRRHLPLLQALAANSPYRHGRDTGLASARVVTMRAWPRTGVPRAMHDFDDFCASAELLSRAADVPDYTWFWWQLRPHPHLGTVEVRALDVQTTHEDTAALVALIQCLARDAAEPAGSGGAPGRPARAGDPPAELVEEGLFRAARFGVVAELPDETGRLRPVSELLAQALDRARRYAVELGCPEELDLLVELVRLGGGAGRQRSLYEIAGMDALLRALTRATGSSAQTED